MAGKLGVQVNLMPQVKRTELQKSVNTAVKQQALNVKVTPNVTKKALRDALQTAASGSKPIMVNITPKVNVNQFVKDVSAQLSNIKSVTVEVNPVLSKDFAKKVEEQVAAATASSTQKSTKSGSRRSSNTSTSTGAAQQNAQADIFAGMTPKQVATEQAQLFNLSRQITKYREDNMKSLTDPYALARLHNLQNAINTTSIRAAQAKAQFAALKAEFAALGMETAPLSAAIAKLFRDHIGTQAVLLALNLARKAIIASVQDVIALDTAMTELKKVTDETDQTYMRFLDRATDRAQKLGATISDVVTATADFARLGYNLEDSEQLAQAAIVYKNVGDGIEDISVASSSIISTMKAFGIEADNAMNIVDIFNKIGNEFAISSVGIGEALSRSAAGLAETNNTLAESVALITAANTVVGFMPLIYGDIGISR